MSHVKFAATSQPDRQTPKHMGILMSILRAVTNLIIGNGVFLPHVTLASIKYLLGLSVNRFKGNILGGILLL